MPYKDPAKRKAAQRRWYENNKEHVKEKVKQYRKDNQERVRSWGDPETRNQKKRDWYVANRPRILRSREEYREENREEIAKRNREKYDVNKDDPSYVNKLRTNGKRSREKLKKQAFEALGGRCVNCGVNEFEFLNIDHVNDDGAEHRRSLREAGKEPAKTIWREIRDGKETRDYQILCWNCNHKKKESTRIESMRSGIENERRYRGNLREAVFNKLGRTCKCCGENDSTVLTVGHVGGEKPKGSAEATYRLIRDADDVLGFQILCWNCNLSRGFNGVCLHKR